MSADELEAGEAQPVYDHYGISKADLIDLMQNKDTSQLEQYGGVEGVCKLIGSDAEAGLSVAEASEGFVRRCAVYDSNKFPEPPAIRFIDFVWDTLHDTTMIILVCASIVSIAIGVSPAGEHPDEGWFEGTAIMVAVILVTLIASLMDYNKELRFRELSLISQDSKVRVVRAGIETEVSIFDVLVGDIVVIDTGDKIPADGLFLTGYSLRLDESVMTGEPDMVKKNEERPFILSGCKVAEGTGHMMVTAVGINTEWGMTMATVQEKRDETPLQVKLDDLATLIGKVGTLFAVMTFLALLIRLIVHEETESDDGGAWEKDALEKIMRALVVAITIVVVAVPEGLPLAVTMSLAYSMRQMIKDNNLVRRLEACETMGGATNICSDKTGTLTENRMTVVKAWVRGRVYEELPHPTEWESEEEQRQLKALAEGVAVNSTAFVSLDENDKWEFVGNKTECALLVMSSRLGFNFVDIRKELPKACVFSFSSARKRMSTVVRNDAGEHRVYTKGASEIVLGLCVNKVGSDGSASAITDAERAELTTAIESFANQGLRTLCLAYADVKEVEGKSFEAREDELESNLTLLGIVGIKDPVRAEVPAAVARCQHAGIKVRMVTGDNLMTARFIAGECGILTEGGIAMEGPDFRKLSYREFKQIAPRLDVLARSSPTDKYNLVKMLKRMGEVVAVTGDGTNDAPALKEADVGLSMGIAGTEVAQEASDIIILDDNFASIVQTVMWGRSVYDNIRKFLQFQLTVNLVALLVAFLGAVWTEESPLTAVQLLWVNLIMDTLGALALATEKPTLDLLDRMPYGRHDALISNHMVRNITAQGVYQLVVLLTILGVPSIFDVDNDSSEHRAIVFNAFVFCQVFNEINARRVYDEINVFEGFFDSPYFSSVVVFTAATQAIIIEFGYAHLTPGQWFGCILIGIIGLPIGVACRLVPVPAKQWMAKLTAGDEDDEPPVAPEDDDDSEAEVVGEPEKAYIELSNAHLDEASTPVPNGGDGGGSSSSTPYVGSLDGGEEGEAAEEEEKKPLDG